MQFLHRALAIIRRWTLAQIIVINIAALLCGAWLIYDRNDQQTAIDRVLARGRQEAQLRAEQDALVASSRTVTREEVQRDLNAMTQEAVDESNAILSARFEQSEDGWGLLSLCCVILLVDWIWAGATDRKQSAR